RLDQNGAGSAHGIHDGGPPIPLRQTQKSGRQILLDWGFSGFPAIPALVQGSSRGIQGDVKAIFKATDPNAKVRVVALNGRADAVLFPELINNGVLGLHRDESLIPELAFLDGSIN